MAFTSLFLCSESSVNVSTKSRVNAFRIFPATETLNWPTTQTIARRMLPIHHMHLLSPVRGGLFCPPLLTPAPLRPGRNNRGGAELALLTDGRRGAQILRSNSIRPPTAKQLRLLQNRRRRVFTLVRRMAVFAEDAFEHEAERAGVRRTSAPR